MQALQAEFHRQGFGRASVENLLAHVEEGVSVVEKDANVVALVSKWDAAALVSYDDYEKVDVTEALVALYSPGDKQLKWVEDLKGTGRFLARS